jgi:hypothetical protein
LGIQKHTSKGNFQVTKLSDEVMMQFFNYITINPAKVDINNIFMKSSARDFLINFMDLHGFEDVSSISYTDRIDSDGFD